MSVVTSQDRQQWALSPATQLFLEELRGTVEDCKERFACGNYIADTAEATSLLNVQATASVQVLKQIINQIEELAVPLGGLLHD